jgi:flagellin-like hook-associated protein FlgL
MANGITLSAGVRANLLSLQNTAQLMQTTQNRLATGKKVNSALDNPINFFTSQSLQSRAGDLNSLLDSMSNGIQTIQAANNGLTSITATVQSMQSTLNQALQDSSWQSASYSIDSTTIGTGSVKNLSFSGGAVTGTVNVAVNSITTAGTQSTLSTSAAYLAPSVSDPAAVESGTFTGLTAGGSYTFKVNGQDITLTDATTGTESGDTLAHAKTSIQAQLDARFGAGSFTVGANTAGDGFSITGKADGTNDVVVSNQAATGGGGAAAGGG